MTRELTSMTAVQHVSIFNISTTPLGFQPATSLRLTTQSNYMDARSEKTKSSGSWAASVAALFAERNAIVPGFWGKERRLGRLQSSHGAFIWIALDHGMALGPIDGLCDLPRLLTEIAGQPATGVVLHRGTAPYLPIRAPVGLVLQTFGLPHGADKAMDKVKVASIDDALRLSADAIAVELNLNSSDLGTAMGAAASMIDAAAMFGIPVLVMLTPATSESAVHSVAAGIRVATELGADLVKVGLPDSILTDPQDELELVRDSVLMAPAVLFAGGPMNADFKRKAELSAKLGFSGACVGRNVFQAQNAAHQLEMLAATFAETNQP